ncbi:MULTISPECIES: hypothetical protein [Acidiphilium]|jgi:hypothetical protein|uniref:Uncharacterized protein n=1 Tax=Acidiphilium multivorum (strain DSM 11245 / JCM 8867 / NBRC 100883 / AIU 301) TaxID=926570 RepID=F0J6L7_ACIMA|nr:MULTISPECIES: hypothetical protein [Acidiphilium]MBU6358069.1 hypothetical protein [Rhodospirillales bacterium]KDM65860.1 hypothetical protein ACIDI_82c00040 [Acidiphilium sp. JA12-A1]MBS3023474.1 hypothetical protein [Acidiphilium multivorum]MDE2326514.1 hypothetical protein [Rhodospirillales bacterium]UNC14554.1 hypothetical protein FE249_10165 [Acidiphilium multivorum]
MATQADAGAHGGGQGDGGQLDSLRIIFATISVMGLVVLLWCFAAALAPSRSGPAPAPLAPAMMNQLR